MHIGHKVVLTKSKMHMTHTTVIMLLLFQSDFDHPFKLQSLVAESWNAAVLDCSASKTRECKIPTMWMATQTSRFILLFPSKN